MLELSPWLRYRRRRGGGGWEELLQAVGRSHTQSVQQQTPFTKRHLFHYFDALWLITSWPVCGMTATYSPVNRKICTCTIWGVGSQRVAGGLGRGEREGKGKEALQENI